MAGAGYKAMVKEVYRIGWQTVHNSIVYSADDKYKLMLQECMNETVPITFPAINPPTPYMYVPFPFPAKTPDPCSSPKEQACNQKE